MMRLPQFRPSDVVEPITVPDCTPAYTLKLEKCTKPHFGDSQFAIGAKIDPKRGQKSLSIENRGL
jgi:hypothetical protein